MNRSMRTIASLGLTASFGAAAMLLSANASAQNMVPQAQPAYAAPAASAIPDHDLWSGRLGLSWFGTRQVPIEAQGTSVTTPLVGVRYWVNTMIGIDGALGFATNSSSTTTSTNGAADVEVKNPTRTAFALHLGVPIAIFNMTHYSFQITPEMDLGIATGSRQMNNVDVDLSGLLFQLGARGGAEIFFGFMGLPQLSLEASVGLFLSSQSAKTSTPAGSTKYSSLTLATAQFANPWDIFRESVAARYYF